MKIRQKSPNAFLLKGNHIGVLLIHGFTGSASEMRPLGMALHRSGYTVHAPLLAGHGTTPEEMKKTTWKDWWESTLEGYETLIQEGCQFIYVAGLSMGGLLSFKLAIEKEISGVISMCTPIFVQDRRIQFAGFYKYFIPYDKRLTEKPIHIENEIVPYDRTPVSCYQSLYRLIRSVAKSLSNVTCPTLIAQARNDETIQPHSAEYIYSHVSSHDKELVWYENSTHIITVDKDRELLFKDVITFISKRMEVIR